MLLRGTKKRSGRTRSVAGLRAGLLVVGASFAWALAGCHGGAQTDIVERELRWQEDQIYAMEDYLTEYQQLLCQYRAENAALKRQIACGSGGRLPESRVRRQEEEIQDTEEIIDNLESPEVPPLLDTMPPSGTGPQSQEYGPNLDFRPARRPTPNVRRMIHEAPIEQPVEQPLDQAAEEPSELPPDAEPLALEAAAEVEEAPPEEITELVCEIEPLQQVVVSGDVLPANEEGGPRLLVDVEPLGASGGPAEFAGELSLMVLDTSGEQPRAVARWNFTPEQLTELLGEEPGPTMEFPLQLPADTPIDLPLEIWARLVPTDGQKLLAHVELDLQQPGSFSSAGPQLEAVAEVASENTPGEEEEVAEEIETARPGLETQSQSVNFSVGDWNGWQVARPDQLLDAAGQQPPDSRWRKSTEPIPTAVNHGQPVVATALSKNPVDQKRLARRAKAAAIEPPRWSPDRNGDSAPVIEAVSPPAWSPER